METTWGKTTLISKEKQMQIQDINQNTILKSLQTLTSLKRQMETQSEH